MDWLFFDDDSPSDSQASDVFPIQPRRVQVKPSYTRQEVVVTWRYDDDDPAVFYVDGYDHITKWHIYCYVVPGDKREALVSFRDPGIQGRVAIYFRVTAANAIGSRKESYASDIVSIL